MPQCPIAGDANGATLSAFAGVAVATSRGDSVTFRHVLVLVAADFNDLIITLQWFHYSAPDRGAVSGVL